MAKGRGGRPTKFKDEYVEQVKKLCALAATDVEIADFFKVSVSTIYQWKLDYPEFSEAITLAKKAANERVERSLYQRAMGYSRTATKVFMPAGANKPVHADYTEHVTGDTAAMIFWLKNRKPKEWRDRVEQDVSGRIEVVRSNDVDEL